MTELHVLHVQANMQNHIMWTVNERNRNMGFKHSQGKPEYSGLAVIQINVQEPGDRIRKPSKVKMPLKYCLRKQVSTVSVKYKNWANLAVNTYQFCWHIHVHQYHMIYTTIAFRKTRRIQGTDLFIDSLCCCCCSWALFEKSFSSGQTGRKICLNYFSLLVVACIDLKECTQNEDSYKKGLVVYLSFLCNSFQTSGKDELRQSRPVINKIQKNII